MVNQLVSCQQDQPQTAADWCYFYLV